MPIISKTKEYFNGREITRIIKCDSQGNFIVILPDEVKQSMHVKDPSSSTMEASLKEYGRLICEYQKMNSVERKIIVYKFDIENSYHTPGLNIQIAANVLIETAITANGVTKYSYKDFYKFNENPIPHKMREIRHLGFFGERPSGYKIIDWTQDRETFFVRFGRNLLNFMNKINDFNNEGTLIEFINNNNNLFIIPEQKQLLSLNL